MKQRAVIRFLILKKLFAMDVMAELQGVYRHEALSLSAVKKWHKPFGNGRITLEDDHCHEDHIEAVFVNLERP
jgi:hypothetical protein